MAPLLLIAISLAGAVFGEEAARGEIFSQLLGLLGDDGAAAIAGLLKSVHCNGQSVVGTLAGAALSLLGATSVFAELRDALDRIRNAQARAPSGTWWALQRTRLMSFGLILGAGFLLLVWLVVSAALAARGRW